MKSILRDIVQHTHGLGVIDTIKVSGTDAATTIYGLATDLSMVLNARFKTPHPDFLGVTGMPNLSKLSTILGIPEYAEGANIKITRDREKPEVMTGVHFENAAGDFKNDYRFLGQLAVDKTFKKMANFTGAKWNVEITPTVANIQRLKFMASANSDQTTFVAKTEDGALKFYFGDAASHAGNFIFDNNVSGVLTKAWSWPTKVFIDILSLPGNKTLKISDQGSAMITVDSGIIDYDYMIPAFSK